jgi:hypothetical protein
MAYSLNELGLIVIGECEKAGFHSDHKKEENEILNKIKMEDLLVK